MGGYVQATEAATRLIKVLYAEQPLQNLDSTFKYWVILSRKTVLRKHQRLVLRLHQYQPRTNRHPLLALDESALPHGLVHPLSDKVPERMVLHHPLPQANLNFSSLLNTSFR